VEIGAYKFLFNLIILGSIQNERGFLWRRCEEHFYVVEYTQPTQKVCYCRLFVWSVCWNTNYMPLRWIPCQLPVLNEFTIIAIFLVSLLFHFHIRDVAFAWAICKIQHYPYNSHLLTHSPEAVIKSTFNFFRLVRVAKTLWPKSGLSTMLGYSSN